MAHALEKILIVECGSLLLAMPANAVRSIESELIVTATPGAPDCVLGLANLRGEIMPVMDLGLRLGGVRFDSASDTASPHQHVVVAPHGGPMALRLDKVLAMIDAEDGAMVQTSAIPELGAARECIRGVLHNGMAGRMVYWLNVDALCAFDIPAQVRTVTGRSQHPLSRTAGGRERDGNPASPMMTVMTFAAAGREFALRLESIVRISPYTQALSPPWAFPGLLGLMADKGETLAVFDLGLLLESSASVAQAHRHYLFVLEHGGMRLGIAAERLGRILVLPEQGAGVCGAEAIHTHDGRGLLMLLNPEALFAGRLPEHLGEESYSADLEHGAAQEALEPDTVLERHVCFGLGEEIFATPMHSVREITVPEAITPVPGTLPHFEGLVNLRGVVIPAMDLRARLGLARANRTDETRMLVAGQGAQMNGLIVDRVMKPLDVRRDTVEPLPASWLPEKSRRYLVGAAKIGDGAPVLLLDLDALAAEESACTTLQREEA
ncbi:chemotaxis protein CheW [Megalodesulfovibrio gigas]|uniref:CheW-like domain-containing protein n=1 Tax=Megalodesulfovibrio gigas (strain ATCC 19364 / DSM 1382 / NCIMB 9332 / VKM B-1759) TaxID=1121448 RepID=T2GFM5_MEGG1|nr:chemotaxis protein CheW [Megalodesulfovibrio gigas]AGW14946.1 hypothetical protein DGI_3244 [Megalodesulfovibrio gigas DSM 1382 = ATCC 19364]